MKSWLEISAGRLAGNYRTALQIVERETAGAALLAVVKANAYGHGAALCAPVLARAGAAWLGVTDAAEGAAVRAALAADGIEPARQPNVLVMCGLLPEDAPSIVAHRLTPVVWSREQIHGLAEAAGTEPVAVHLEVDTGMTRQGVPLAELDRLLTGLRAEPRLRLDGLMTHFASAENAASSQTIAQRLHFEHSVEQVSQAAMGPVWLHAGNTSAIDNRADGSSTLAWLAHQAARLGARPMARAGLGLYGYCLPITGLTAGDGDETPALQPRVSPVMTWKTRIVALRDVPPGAAVGYNGTFVAPRAMRLALLPVGYADGLRRELSGPSDAPRGWVMLRGRRAFIVGRVSMNLTTVDVTGIEGIAPGDEAILLGQGITADDHAALAGTIAYEILCGLRAPPVLVA